jgi:hypothetical protein
MDEEDGACQDGDLDEGGDSREKPDGEQASAHEMGEHHVVEHKARNEPGLAGALQGIDDKGGRRVASHQQPAGDQADAKVYSDAVEPGVAAGVRPRD